jgi:hypothetical protein
LVTANFEWTASTVSDFITLIKSGNYLNMTFTANNNTTNRRYATINFYNELSELVAEFPFIQRGMIRSVIHSSVLFNNSFKTMPSANAYTEWTVINSNYNGPNIAINKLYSCLMYELLLTGDNTTVLSTDLVNGFNPVITLQEPIIKILTSPISPIVYVLTASGVYKVDFSINTIEFLNEPGFTDGYFDTVNCYLISNSGRFIKNMWNENITVYTELPPSIAYKKNSMYSYSQLFLAGEGVVGTYNITQSTWTYSYLDYNLIKLVNNGIKFILSDNGNDFFTDYLSTPNYTNIKLQSYYNYNWTDFGFWLILFLRCYEKY